MITDFTEYDKAAEYYFNVLRLPTSYMPSHFTLFGWVPPAEKFGEKPYEGGGVPLRRGLTGVKLRPEYKRAYQAFQRAPQGEYVKAKGWHRKLVPLHSRMSPTMPSRTLSPRCRLCRDDPRSIRRSLLRHVASCRRDSYLSLWGIGHYGIVSRRRSPTTARSGTQVRWTTDGQMSPIRPTAVERLLLYFYCFRPMWKPTSSKGMTILRSYQFWLASLHPSGAGAGTGYLRAT